MTHLFIILLIILILILFIYLTELHVYVLELYGINTHRKTKLYKMALNKAKNTNKPLMVIGDPDNGSKLNREIFYKIFDKPYGYGDICVDLSGCPDNKNGNNVKGKLEDVINSFQDNSHVIFISQTLEYIDSDKLDYVLKNLYRVSGGDLFVVNLTKYNGNSYNDRYGTFDVKNKILKCPPIHNYFEYEIINQKN